MLRDLNQIEEVYNDIITKARNDAVLICASCECDSLCALRILTRLLEDDHIRYVFHAVNSYTDIRKIDELYLRKQEVDQFPVVVMINCCANTDIQAVIDLRPESESPRTVYIFDSHRPFDLTIAEDAMDNVIVICEDKERQDFQDTLNRLHGYGFQGDTDEDEDEDEEMVDSDETGDDNAHGGETRPAKRPRTSPESRKKRRRAAGAEDGEIDMAVAISYYAASFYGLPAAVLMQLIAERLGRIRNELLWYAILGITEHFVLERISFDQYCDYHAMYLGEVKKLNAESALVARTMDAVDIPLPAEGFIKDSQEYRLMLLRHWSLYESLCNSTHVIARFEAWTAAGRDRIDQLLAKMGLSRIAAQQMFTFMTHDQRTRISETLAPYAKEEGLDETFTFPSFIRRENFDVTVSAPDVVYAVTALLEYAPEDEYSAVKAFYEAYGALEPKTRSGRGPLADGIRSSIALQQALVSQSCALIENKQLLSWNTLRYCRIHGSPWGVHFTKPLALTKLAIMLMEFMRSGKRKPKPLVVAAFNEANSSYLVVGLHPLPRFGNLPKNNFASAFANASQRSKARTKFDSFEAACVEVHKEDLTGFVDQLRLLLEKDDDM